MKFVGKRLLIIGGGHEQVPAIRLAQEKGIRVIVSDRDPAAPGALIADHFAQVSTDDKAGNLVVARNHVVHGVMTLGSETAVPVVAHIADALGLPGYSPKTAFLATNKNAMRQAFINAGVPTPKSSAVANLAELERFCAQAGFPVVVKPSDCSGQRGATLLRNGSDAAGAFEAAVSFATDGLCIAEEFCEGPEINVTAVVTNGDAHFLSFSDRVTDPNTNFGIAVEHVAPPNLDATALAAVRAASLLAINAIGLRDGIAYPQVIATRDGPRVIEIAARIPGGHMREVALHLSGIDMIEVAILMALGVRDPLSKCATHATAPALCVRFVTAVDFPDVAPMDPVSFAGVDSAAQGDGVLLARVHHTAGTTMPPLLSSTGRFGAVLAVGDTREQAQLRARNAASKIRVKVLGPVESTL
jgi:biotin carboxylase